MKSIAAVALLYSASALKDPQLKLKSATCLPTEYPGCALECRQLGCEGATNDAELNTCLKQLNPNCLVGIVGTISATLERNIDFCNTAVDPAGQVLNVPYLGSWTVMANPTVTYPRPRFFSTECEVLSDHMTYAVSTDPAVIFMRGCVDHNSHFSETREILGAQTAGKKGEWTYPLEVTRNDKAVFLSLPHQECYARRDELIFNVEIKDSFTGGRVIVLDEVIETGTVEINRAIQRG